MNIIFKIAFFLLVFTSQFYAQDSINLLDKNGKFHGKYRKFHANGNLRYEGTFEHGKEVGIFKFYAISGEKTPIAIKEYNTKNDSIKVSFFATSGKLESKGMMIGKNREGKWQYFFSDGKTLMSVENYKNDLLEGEFIVYYKNGKITEISNYKNGKLHGNRKRFADDGHIVEDLNYENGIAHGPAKLYDEKGDLYGKGNYENGLKTGVWEFKIEGEWISTNSPDKIVIKK